MIHPKLQNETHQTPRRTNHAARPPSGAVDGGGTGGGPCSSFDKACSAVEEVLGSVSVGSGFSVAGSMLMLVLLLDMLEIIMEIEKDERK